jgi:tetratricopeptide (TPR) repeat protein
MTPATNRIAVALLSAGLILGADTALRTEGIAAFQSGRYSSALPKLQQALKDDPTDKLAARFLALTEAARGNCKSALPVLARDADPLAGLGAAKCYSALGDDESALALLGKLAREHPDNPDILYESARLHMKAFNDDTFVMFQRAPASYRVHELSAEIFEVEAKYADAAAEYRKAIELNPSAPELHYRLGRDLLMESHEPASLAQAATEFQAELRLSPEDGACEYQLGQIAQVGGNAPVAQMHFEKALSLSPDFVAPAIALGKLYSEQKKFNAAIPLLQRAVTLQPNNEAAHYALLTAYRNSGRMDKAKEEKAELDRLQKPPEGEFSDFLKKLGEKRPQQ